MKECVSERQLLGGTLQQLYKLFSLNIKEDQIQKAGWIAAVFGEGSSQTVEKT